MTRRMQLTTNSSYKNHLAVVLLHIINVWIEKYTHIYQLYCALIQIQNFTDQRFSTYSCVVKMIHI